jgi:hypothetical protein
VVQAHAKKLKLPLKEKMKKKMIKKRELDLDENIIYTCNQLAINKMFLVFFKREFIKNYTFYHPYSPNC